MKKKIIQLLTILFILTGCQNNQNIQNNLEDIPDNNIPEIKEEIYIDDNPIKVSLYDGKYKIKDTYETTLKNLKDINVFDVYYTDIDKVESSSSRISYPKYYNQYENIENYKTGFYITFEANNESLDELVLDPSSQYNMNPYLYIYLYDDVNQKKGAYYSHLKMEDINENTIISSIKLFLGEKANLITSPITLTVFTYDGEEDFDEEGLYRGNSSYTIEITFKNQK